MNKAGLMETDKLTRMEKWKLRGKWFEQIFAKLRVARFSNPKHTFKRGLNNFPPLMIWLLIQTVMRTTLASARP